MDSGGRWTQLTGNLDSVTRASGIIGLELVKTHSVYELLVSAFGGVYASAVNPAAVPQGTANLNLNWSLLGSGIPNVPVTDIHYDYSDDILVASTFGRGIWAIRPFTTALDTLQVTGDESGAAGTDDHIVLRQDPQNATKIQVLVNDQIEYDDVYFSLGTVTINGGLKQDTIDIVNIPIGLAVTVAEDGTASVNVGENHRLNSIGGPLTIRNSGGSGKHNIALTLDDSDDPRFQDSVNLDTVIIGGVNFGRVPLGGPTLYNSGDVSSVTLETGFAGATVNVQSALAPLTIVGNSSTATINTVNIGYLGSVAYIVADVTITNPSGFTTVIVDDSADDAAFHDSVALSTETISGSGYGRISNLATGTIRYKYADSRSVTVNTGSGGGIVALAATGVATTLTGSGRHTTVTVGDHGDLSAIAAALTISGTDLIADGSAGGWSPNINLTHTNLTGLSSGAQINFLAAGLHSLTVRGSPAGDYTYTITDTPAVIRGTTLYTGGAGNDVTVYVRGTSGYFSLHPQGNNNTVTLGSLGNDTSSITGAVDISPGSNELITVNDQGRTRGQSYSLLPWGLGRNNGGNFNFSSVYTFVLNCASSGDTGRNTINIEGNPTAQIHSFYVNCGPGDDVINVGHSSTEPGLTPNTLTGIGLVTIDGPGARKALNVNDQGDQTGQTFSVVSDILSNGVEGGGATIEYANIGTLTLNGGQATNTFTVDGTPQGTNLIVNTQKGINAVDVAPSRQNLKAQIGGDLTVNSTGTATTVTLNNKADPVPEHYEMGLFKVFLPDPLAIYFNNVATLILNGGVPDTYTVTGVVAGTTVIINPAAGPNSFSINPAGIQGNLIIGGSGGGAVLIDDSGSTADATYTVTASTVQKDGSGSITYTGAQSVLLQAGSGRNTINVQSTTATTPVSILGGAGTDIFNIGSSANLLSTIQGPLFIDGQGGSNFVNFNDQGSTAATAYTVGATQLERTGGIPIPFAHSSHVYLYASAADDTFDLQSSAIIHIGAGDRTVSIPRVPAGVTAIYDAGVGHDTFNVGNAANTLNEIRGGLGIFGLPGYLSTLNVNDQGSPGNFGYAFFQPTSQTAAILERSDATDVNFDQVGQVVLNTGRGGLANVVSVAAIKAGTSVTVNLAGNDFANVGPYGKLDGIQGPLTLHGQGNDSVYLYDNANVFSGSPPVYTITANTVGRPGIAGITYDGLKALNLNTGSAAPANPWSFINVSSTAAGTATTVNAGSGYQVQVGGGPNRLDGVLAPVTVNGLGNDALNIVDNGGTTGYVYTLSYDALSGRSRVARAGYAAIDFAGISFAAQITAGSGDDTFNIEGKDPACFLVIWGGGGNNTFNVSPTAQNLDGVRGALAIFGTGPGTTGGSATLTINDQADPIDRGWRLTRGGVTLTTVVGIGYQDVKQVTVNAGGGNNSFNVEGLTATIPVTVNAGTGTTAVKGGVIGNTLDPLAGSLIVHGAGVTSVTFNNQGADPHIGHGDYWTANQADFYNAQHLHVDFTGVAQMTLSDPALTTNSHIFYAMPAVGQLTINGAGNDIIQAVAPAVGQNDWWITGHNAGNLNNIVSFNNVYFLETAYSGTDVFHLLGNASETAIGNPGSGATPVLDLSGYTPGAVVKLPGPTAWGSVGTDTGFNGIKQIIGTAGSDTLVGPEYATTWVLSGTNAGRVVGAAYYAQVFVADVAFTSFENLRGGSAADTFAFQPGGGVSGRIDGGGGTNTLDYSAYVGDIVVDLARGTANGTGGVAGIANVTGSQGNDILVGDANPNVLRGGTGRNLIIGGAGADQLFGGGGDNIQIGGTTAYDQDLTALAAIMKEFTRTDLNFHQRVDHLMNGTGLNGSYVLNTDPTLGPVTVFDDGAVDVLNAGGALDWFFVHKKQDVIVNQKPGDKVTPV
jgi:hypothetical protein